MIKLKFLLTSLLFIYVSFYAQSNLLGFYKGNINIMEQNLEIEIEFKSADNVLTGIMNIPAQNAKNLLLNNLKNDKDKISFQIMEAPRSAVFDGVVNADSIYGTFTQLSFKGTFVVRKAEKKEEIIIKKDYIEEEVLFNNGNINIAGTLSYPKNRSNLPAVILITGSGAQNRDSEVFGFKLYAILADYLTKNGIAVLRCDDRGVGGTSGSVQESTSEDFAGDVVAAFNFLKSVKVIDSHKIGLYGHSEGGIIAPIAISSLNDVAFAVLVSAPAVSGEEIIYKQVELILRSNNASEDEIKTAIQHNKEIFNLIKSGASADSLKNLIATQVKAEMLTMPEENKKQIKDMDAFIQSIVDSNIRIYSNNWFNFFLNYNPAPILQNVKCPVLLVFGGMDKQVDATQNRSILEQNLKLGGNSKVTTLLFENANHLFQLAKTGSPNEYSKLEKNYIAGFLEQITEWIINNTK